jgi:hypothetical protein
MLQVFELVEELDVQVVIELPNLILTQILKTMVLLEQFPELELTLQTLELLL